MLWAAVGAFLGQLYAGPLAWLYPTGRLVRGVLAMGKAESDWNPDFTRGAAEEVGYLQWLSPTAWRPNIAPDGWRRSPFWSGFATMRYLASRPSSEVWATLAGGERGLWAWRWLWTAGKVKPGLPPGGVSAPVLELWERTGRWTWLLTVVAYLAILPGVAQAVLGVVGLFTGRGR